VRQLTLRGLSFTARHPLATRVSVGAGIFGLYGGLRSEGNAFERLVEAGIGAAVGVTIGLLTHGLTRPLRNR